jgi:hypothetical protein
MEDDLSSIRLQLQQIQENLTAAKYLMDSENSHINNTVYMLSMSLNDSQQENSDKLQQLNSSINEARTQLSDKIQELNEAAQTQLNVSVDRLHQQVVTDLIPQLNSSINEAKTQLSDKIQELNETAQTRLNVSVDQLHHQVVTDLIPRLNSSLNSQQASLVALNTSIQMDRRQYSESVDELRRLHPGLFQASPVSSCAALIDLPYPSPSGHYWVVASNGSAVRVYCDMTRSCGGVTGWMRVAELDMTNSIHQCPSHLVEATSSSRRICRINSVPAACSPAMVYSTVLEYSKVCGRIRAFRTGSSDGFEQHGVRGQDPTIDGNYVDGVSLTHGRPRQHIWTFAARPSACTCENVPMFVGTHYSCDGNAELWRGCPSSSDSCCSFNNPPWFYRQLSQPTTNDIEMRVCRDEGRWNEDIQIQAIDLYVQ